MFPSDEPQGSVRSAAEVNDQIRGLWVRAGGRLSGEQRREYELLVTEWATAARAEIVTAA